MKVKELFKVCKGSHLDYSNQKIDKNDGINFVSRNSNNNGVVGRIKQDSKMTVFSSGAISVSLGGSYLLSCFVQREKFVTAEHMAVLIPRVVMSEKEKWFYSYALRKNRFKFLAFAREADKYIEDIDLPDKIPLWVYSANLELPKTKNTYNDVLEININDWKFIKLKELFNMRRGSIGKLTTYQTGKVPVISLQESNQGINAYLDVDKKYSNALTISLNGNGGYCVYHKYSFNAGRDCGVLIPRFNLTKNVGIFLSSIINKNSYKYQYGRKPSLDKIKEDTILIPFKNGKPDFDYMGYYISKLPNADLL
ncbi:hypothetical protein IV37_GL000705 [Fructilactobacillus fructivorans]|uniref:restriction endonuclease subunit S n=1 Tax=Fructilactobacillus fructivorans TaxID=1614 RepID=UPI0007048FBC|nr:restriction endonuclease subunit S [Fructilactobacillus fructivorans]KRN13067.1 hypothetical protein IV37_GL000705 [Fructilactobacillus fructivorans]